MSCGESCAIGAAGGCACGTCPTPIGCGCGVPIARRSPGPPARTGPRPTALERRRGGGPKPAFNVPVTMATEPVIVPGVTPYNVRPLRPTETAADVPPTYATAPAYVASGQAQGSRYYMPDRGARGMVRPAGQATGPTASDWDTAEQAARDQGWQETSNPSALQDPRVQPRAPNPNDAAAWAALGTVLNRSTDLVITEMNNANARTLAQMRIDAEMRLRELLNSTGGAPLDPTQQLQANSLGGYLQAIQAQQATAAAAEAARQKTTTTLLVTGGVVVAAAALGTLVWALLKDKPSGGGHRGYERTLGR